MGSIGNFTMWEVIQCAMRGKYSVDSIFSPPQDPRYSASTLPLERLFRERRLVAVAQRARRSRRHSTETRRPQTIASIRRDRGRRVSGPTTARRGTQPSQKGKCRLETAGAHFKRLTVALSGFLDASSHRYKRVPSVRLSCVHKINENRHFSRNNS